MNPLSNHHTRPQQDSFGACLAPLALAALIGTAGCSRKSASTGAPTASATAAVVPSSLLTWAGDGPVAIIHAKASVLARDVRTGRVRILSQYPATWVFHDASLDLLWIQTSEGLDVIDMRADQETPTGIARGIPAGVPIGITRKSKTGNHVSASVSGCDTGKTLVLDWEGEPRVRYLDEHTGGWVFPSSAELIGRVWLLAQLERAPGSTRHQRRTFPFGSTPRLGIVAQRRGKCPAEICAQPIAFDATGRMIVVTAFEQGDCQHPSCHLYDPATKRFATPPLAPSWGDLDTIPPGSCGVYHFDRSGQQYLIGNLRCTVGGGCEDLDGEAVGWVSGGTDVGTSG